MQVPVLRWCDGAWLHFQLMMLAWNNWFNWKGSCFSSIGHVIQSWVPSSITSRSTPSGYVCLSYFSYFTLAKHCNFLFSIVLRRWNLTVLFINMLLICHPCLKNNFSSFQVWLQILFPGLTADPAVWFIFWNSDFILGFILSNVWCITEMCSMSCLEIHIT